MRNKYNNRKTIIDGIEYDSRKEAARAVELEWLRKGGQVKAWLRQPKFPVVIKGRKICDYIADFKVHWMDGRVTIEDVKGYRNGPAWRIYRLKKKLVEALYDIIINEVEPNDRNLPRKALTGTAKGIQ